MSKDIIKRLRAAEFVSFVCEDTEASVADFELAKQAARTIAALQEQILWAVALERAIWIKAIENCFDPSALNDVEQIVEKYRAAAAKEAGK